MINIRMSRRNTKKIKMTPNIIESSPPRIAKENRQDSGPNDEDSSDKRFRAYSIFLYFTVLVLIGVPIWLYTTGVYRATLPLDQIDNMVVRNETTNDLNLPFDLNYDILISFVHPNPKVTTIEIDAVRIEEYLLPLVNNISAIANFFVKSQWIYTSELRLPPMKKHNEYIIIENELPHIITPLETNSWGHISSHTTLNFVIYFPHCDTPLNLYNSKMEKSKTNAFVSPRWGGVLILNGDKASCSARKYSPDPKLIASTFQKILLELFKIPEATDFHISKLKKARIMYMLESSKKTLKSLIQLLTEISSIVINNEVAEKVNTAVENIHKTEKFLDEKNYDNAFKKIKHAFISSEEGFSHPSLLALLYFPDDQKYAIYIPLFLPVMIPVTMSLLQIYKIWEKRLNFSIKAILGLGDKKSH